jgi:hypothetical protein
MDTHFGTHSYSLKDLFRDEQRHVLHLIIAGTLQDFEDTYITLYENSRGLMGFLRDTGTPVPRYLMSTAGTALNLKLQKMFRSESIETNKLKENIYEITTWNAELDDVSLEFITRRRLEGLMASLLEEPENTERLAEVLLLVESLAQLPLEVNLWQTQNMYWNLLHSRTFELNSSNEETNDQSSWREAVRILGYLLFFNVPAVLDAAKVAQ